MTYTATTPRNVQIFFLIIMFQSILRNKDKPLILYFSILIALLIFITIFIRYKIKIVEGNLTFQVRVFSFMIYNREVNHKQISKIKFFHAGWGKKCALVRNRKGLNFRILNFEPETIFHDLNNFANEYEIPVKKTKDYLVFER